MTFLKQSRFLREGLKIVFRPLNVHWTLRAYPSPSPPIPPGLFEGGSAWGGVPAAYNSKAVDDNEIKSGGVVKDH